MREITKFTGYLGNQMFQHAALYSFCKDKGIDFYCQDEKYFKKYEDDIRKMFDTEMGFTPFVSIHVRRGDYLVHPYNLFHVDLTSTDYYEKAIALFPNEQFLVFSNDIEWCKKSPLFKGDNFQFVEGNNDVEDMNMMGSCSKGNIIANSSFSFWAAWLNPNPAKKIIAPKSWYIDGNQERTVCPQSWIRI